MVSGSQNVWFTFSFDKNGNVKKYSFFKGKRWIFEDYPRTGFLKWEVTRDSIFKYLESSEKIIKISDDTICSIDLQTKEKHTYFRVKNALNIQK